MSETTNYGLFVSNDDQMTFREWRLKLSGETDSNMTKIDAALGEMQGKLDNVVQADFEESNPESPAYIQNRTHWKEVIGEDAEIIPQQKATFTALGSATVTGVAQGMKEGVKYVASIGGLEMEGRCKKHGYELYVGNASLMNSALENTGEGFCVNYFADTFYLLFVRNAATGASLKFSMRSVQETVYHKLDKAYLPDDLGGGDNMFFVNASVKTEDDGTKNTVIDKTLADIDQAITDGKVVYARYVSDDVIMMPFVARSEHGAVFGACAGSNSIIQFYYLIMYEHGGGKVGTVSVPTESVVWGSF